MKNNLFTLLITLFLTSLLALPAQARQIALSAELGTPVVEAGRTHKTFLKISLTGFELSGIEERTPANVALVLDESGSMTGEKLEEAKEAALLAVDLLNEDDILSIISYDSHVKVLVPATRVADKSDIRRAIRAMKAGGQTALFAGVSKGAKEIRKFIDKERVNRIILLSDGQANVGPSTVTELGELGKSLGKEGISVTTIGLGAGYNEDLMANLAGYSDGNHAFVEDPEDLVKIFNYEFGDVLSVVAQDLLIRIEFEDGIRPLRILGRNGDIIGREVTTRMNQLYSDQQKYILLEVEVPEGAADQTRELASVTVSYQNMANRQQENVRDKVSVSYSSSSDEVARSRNREVVTSATKQVANEMSKQALKLRDEGKREEAQSLLNSSADFVRAQGAMLGGEEKEQLEAFSVEVESDADAITLDEEWDKTRKAIRAKQYRQDTQQNY
ncbi:MAG: VWA domain-containing protein [Sedimenticolaceae bacterium]|nr:VWA domain-containing protein [Sedimenticolaceae bacterium]